MNIIKNIPYYENAWKGKGMGQRWISTVGDDMSGSNL